MIRTKHFRGQCIYQSYINMIRGGAKPYPSLQSPTHKRIQCDPFPLLNHPLLVVEALPSLSPLPKLVIKSLFTFPNLGLGNLTLGLGQMSLPCAPWSTMHFSLTVLPIILKLPVYKPHWTVNSRQGHFVPSLSHSSLYPQSGVHVYGCVGVSVCLCWGREWEKMTNLHIYPGPV